MPDPLEPPVSRMSVERRSCFTADGPHRVLVADKCKDTADSLKCLLKLWGHDAEVACDGEAAIATALAYRPDVILMDVVLPIISGCEVVRRLRGEPGIRDALMVAITAYSDQCHRQQAMEANFDMYLVKPMNPAALQDVLMRSEKE